MRPEILFPLFRPVTALKGVGPRIAKLVGSLAGERVVDLVWHLPTGIVDRRHAPKIAAAAPGRVATLVVRIEAHEQPRNRRMPYRVRCGDDTGEIALVFFHARPDYLMRILPPGGERVVSGVVEVFGGALQMTHPDHVVPVDERATVEIVEPVYSLTAGLSPKTLARAIADAVDGAPDLPEWLDESFRRSRGWPSWAAAVRAAHNPATAADLMPESPSRARLAYDELLANQLALALVRRQMRGRGGRAITGTGEKTARILEAVPYRLTGAQSRALDEIRGDLASPQRMIRLLQGDVGSGKTIVALLAMAAVVEAGAQAAMMAPTEILARQHYDTIAPLAERAEIRIALLTGRDRGESRRRLLSTIEAGAIDIVVGTHALFQEDVSFHDLALAVIDEQHRFGVHQRLRLTQKGRPSQVDMLVMTATPIPRTLTLTAFGDMDVSRLDEKPPGRRPVRTAAAPLDRIDEVIAAVRRALDAGNRVYWVCPIVEESDRLDVSAAEERYRALEECFGERVGLVHGRMKAADKDRVMESFVAGEKSLLVATTVIEVGVDVPEATVMIVEHAERFGLAQLHQLRGRVGRGPKPASCVLLYAPPLGETAEARLRALRETDDGFVIAEEDLRLRGAGELLGARQSGVPHFRLAGLAIHGDLLAAARDDSRLILDRDPDLLGPRGAALRVLLYLFERDQAVRLLSAG